MVAYEKYDRNEVGGERGCQLLMSSVIEEIKGTIRYYDGDLNNIDTTYAHFLAEKVGVDYASKFFNLFFYSYWCIFTYAFVSLSVEINTFKITTACNASKVTFV